MKILLIETSRRTNALFSFRKKRPWLKRFMGSWAHFSSRLEAHLTLLTPNPKVLAQTPRTFKTKRVFQNRAFRHLVQIMFLTYRHPNAWSERLQTHSYRFWIDQDKQLFRCPIHQMHEYLTTRHTLSQHPHSRTPFRYQNNVWAGSVFSDSSTKALYWRKIKVICLSSINMRGIRLSWYSDEKIKYERFKGVGCSTQPLIRYITM